MLAVRLPEHITHFASLCPIPCSQAEGQACSLQYTLLLQVLQVTYSETAKFEMPAVITFIVH